MADEMIAPLIDNYENKEKDENIVQVENEIIHKDNDNELANLLNHQRINNEENRRNNNRQNYNRNINDNINNRGININLNLNHKKSFIFLTFAIQLCIYYIILNKYYEKTTFIKDNIILFLIISSVIITVIFFVDIINNNIFREMKIVFLIFIVIISSLGLYIFLYAISFLLDLKNMKILLLISIVMYLTMSIAFLLYNDLDNLEVTTNAFFSSMFFSIILDLLFFHYKKIDGINFIIIIFFVFALSIVSLYHQNILFENRNIIIKDFPIILTYLFMDIYAICLAIFIIYILFYIEAKNKSTAYNNRKKYNLDDLYK